MRVIEIAYEKGYRADKSGNIIGPRGFILVLCTDTKGYLTSNVRTKNGCTRLHAHRLQAYQKYGDKVFEEGIMVRHKNGNPLDNSWDNILIGTNSDNQLDIPEQIRIKRAKYAASHNIKYDVNEVKEFHLNSRSYKETMEKFGITSKGTLHAILKR